MLDNIRANSYRRVNHLLLISKNAAMDNSIPLYVEKEKGLGHDRSRFSDKRVKAIQVSFFNKLNSPVSYL